MKLSDSESVVIVHFLKSDQKDCDSGLAVGDMLMEEAVKSLSMIRRSWPIMTVVIPEFDFRQSTQAPNPRMEQGILWSFEGRSLLIKKF